MKEGEAMQRIGLYCMVLIILVWVLVTMLNIADLRELLNSGHVQVQRK